MARPVIILILVSLLAVACSDSPSAPETGQWTRDDLLGSWSGQLAGISMVPETTIPNWDEYRDDPLYDQRYFFTDLDVTVNVIDSLFLLLLRYRSDSLIFVYSEKGHWELAGNSPRLLRMDSTSVLGKLETWYGAVMWERSECCWRADLDLDPGAFSTSGFTAGELKISNIQSTFVIPDLVLKKENGF